MIKKTKDLERLADEFLSAAEERGQKIASGEDVEVKKLEAIEKLLDQGRLESFRHRRSRR